MDTRLLGKPAEVLGAIDVPSGRLCVCDAGTFLAPVEVALAAGEYVVRVHHERGENLAMILASPCAEPERWELVGAYGVDAGMAGFFDAELLARLEAHRFPISVYDDLISFHLDPAEAAGHAGAFVPFGGSRFAACRSGGGDGVYPVFAGRDAAGKVVVVATTFL